MFFTGMVFMEDVTGYVDSVTRQILQVLSVICSGYLAAICASKLLYILTITTRGTDTLPGPLGLWALSCTRPRTYTPQKN